MFAAAAQAQVAPASQPETDARETELLSGVRQLTFEGRRAGEGYFSRDGTKLVFQSEREPGNPFYQIYLMDLETGDVERVSTGTGKTTCAWIHPDGTQVLFASTHEDSQAVARQQEEIKAREAGTQRRYSWDYDEHYELYTRNLKDGSLKRLTNALGYDAEGTWSPDGKLIAFSSNRLAYSEPLNDEQKKILETDKSYFVDLFIMNADGSGLRGLTSAPGYDGGPFFSADGKKICWRRFTPDGAQAEVYTMNVDGTDEQQLTRMGALSWAPFFHPSGEYLIFTTNKHGFDNFELYLVDAAGRHEPVRVTYTPGFDGLPAFSPDGRRLAWTSSRGSGKQGQLFLAEWNHAEARRLLDLQETAVRSATITRARRETSSSTAPEIRAEDVRKHVERLASDEFAGRLTGTDGERLATEYVAGEFKRIGLAPAGPDGAFFQDFEFTAGAALGPDNLLSATMIKEKAGAQTEKTQQFAVDQDWRPLAFTASGEFGPAEVAFGGYGIVAPKDGDQAEYDSFVHLDVKSKWVIVLRYMPEGVSADRRQHLARFASLRYKAMVLRGLEARGMIVVSGPTSKVKEQLIKLDFDATQSGTSLPSLTVADSLVDELLSASGKTLQELQEALDGGDPQMGFVLKGVTLSCRADVEKVKKHGRNVLARLPAAQRSTGAAILVGAHVDHLGRGETSGSLARDDEKGQIHYGADDNASGVAGMLEIAEYLADQQASGKLASHHDVIFAAWSGEELGLLGSAAFVERLAGQGGDSANIQKQIAAALNMDMIGRFNKTLVLQGVGSSPIWAKEIEQRNAPLGLSITPSNESYLPTDATSFYTKGVPILSAFTGSHAEYHTPRDKPETLDYDGAAKVAKLMGLVARSLAMLDEAPEYVAMTKPETGQRAGLRAYMGTIPDYAAGDVVGLKLSGVAKGGPAETGGVRGGDVIVELAGRKIENIYDYTYAIDALKIGEAVKVVVMRDGQRVELTVTPASRE